MIHRQGNPASAFSVFQHGEPAPDDVVDRIAYALNYAEGDDLHERVLREVLAGNRIVIEPDGVAYWYSPEGDDDGCLEPHFRNGPATADEVALIESLRTEDGQ